MIKFLVVALCLAIPSQSFAAQPRRGLVSTPNAPQQKGEGYETGETRDVKIAGGATAGAGAGLMGYAAAAAVAGPVAWAAGLIFVGGMSVYLAVRQERGYRDLYPPQRPVRPAPVRPPEYPSPEPQSVQQTTGRI